MGDLIEFYEKFGYYKELIGLLEQGLRHERAHPGIFTELGSLYAKYQPNSLMDFINVHSAKIMIPKLIRSCELFGMWSEAVVLNEKYEQFDKAVIIMIEHSPTAFSHQQFVQDIMRVSNFELYYRAMSFYLEEQPMQLNDLLKVLSKEDKKFDLVKCVQHMKRTGYIALIEPFLQQVQYMNVSAVNEALNEIYLEKQDYESLRHSIKDYDSFESSQLAQSLEHHELLDCRRISALLYRRNKRYQKSIEISQKDKMFKDAMETVAESKDATLAENLLRNIIEMDDKELFAAMLYSCYSLIKPDVVMELAWRKDMFEFIMPYMIQTMKDMSVKVDSVQKSTDDIKKKEEKNQKAKQEEQLDIGVHMFPDPTMGMGGPGPLAITQGPGIGMGGGMGGPMNMGFGMGGPMGGPMGGMGGMNMGGSMF